MARKNTNLHSAQTKKYDEYYTLLEDIEAECKNYESLFKDQIIYCNCDHPLVSNFFVYFALNFKRLNLKKLICTCYNNPALGISEPDIFYEQDNDEPIVLDTRGAFKVVISKPLIDKNGKEITTDTSLHSLIKEDIDNQIHKYVTPLKYDGDFKSLECVEILKECDIAVTNPPFTLFSDYIALMTLYHKKFLVIGSMSAITYKVVFPLLKNNEMWLGYNIPTKFILPTGKYSSVLTRWYTNLKTDKKQDFLKLYKTYTPEEYPTFDNYDAINVTNADEIPKDYNGIMAVPISFMDKYNPNQFELIGHEHDLTGEGKEGRNVEHGQFEINGKGVFKRILIRKRQ